MAERKKMFSDAWHRVANKHAALRANVEVQRQMFRGRRWYILRDPFKNTYYRVTDAAYQVIGRLRLDRTIDDVWQECLDIDAETAPGQEEVIEILGHLNNANLIQSDMPADSESLFQKHRKTRGRELRQQWMNFLFVKFSLWNPDAFLRAIVPMARWILNPWGAVVWLVVAALAGKVVVENASQLGGGINGVLSPDNLPLLFVATVVLKGVHEFGHAIFCRLFGGVVPSTGVMMVALMPLPYVDATSSWGFRDKWKRIAVSAGGMIFELFVAALAALVWAETDRGTVNSLAYNVMFSASVSTLMFNLNPLLKFDGYYIFSDLFELPNLQQRATAQLKYFLESRVFGSTHAVDPSRSATEAVWLTVYGIGAGLYRIFLMLSIALFIAEEYFELGVALALFCVVIYVIVPVFKFLRYALSSPQLKRVRGRVVGSLGAATGTCALALFILPVPRHVQQPGVVIPEARHWLHAPANGFVTRVCVPSGAHVRRGEMVAVLSDPELDHQIAVVTASLRQTEARCEMAERDEPGTLRVLQAQMAVERENLRVLEADRAALQVQAPADGIWAAPDLAENIGAWFVKGTPLGRIVAPDDAKFVVVVSQREAYALFSQSAADVGIRLRGRADEVLPATIERVVPAEQNRLPTPALGWSGGGEVEVSRDAADGQTTVDTFYLVEAKIADAAGRFLDEHRGVMRWAVEPAPIGVQVADEVRKLLQKRLNL